MKMLKDILKIFLICYIVSLLTKIILNKLVFSNEYLIDALIISSGTTFGYLIGSYIRIIKDKKR